MVSCQLQQQAFLTLMVPCSLRITNSRNYMKTRTKELLHAKYMQLCLRIISYRKHQLCAKFMLTFQKIKPKSRLCIKRIPSRKPYKYVFTDITIITYKVTCLIDRNRQIIYEKIRYQLS